MTRSQIAILAVLGLLDLLLLCGGAVFIFAITEPEPVSVQVSDVAAVAPMPMPAPATSTATREPPTATRALPSATWVLPVPTTSPLAAAILAAVDKSSAATAYRMEMSMSAKGALGLASSGTANQEVTLANLSGEVNGRDTHSTVKGMMAVIFTGDPAKSIELAQVGGKTYVHGPLPLLGAKEDRWYALQPDQTSGLKSALGSDDVLTGFGGVGIDYSRLAPAGTETLDNRKCDVYSADKATAQSAFLEINPDTQLKDDTYAPLQGNTANAELKIWICDDGYFHQLRLALDAQDPAKSGQVTGVKLLVRTYDFGGKVQVSAPAGAVALTSPLLQTLVPPTPTVRPTAAATPSATPTFGYLAYPTPPPLPSSTPSTNRVPPSQPTDSPGFRGPQ